MARKATGASEIGAFALGLGRVSSLMHVALQAELIRIGTDAKVRVNEKHERPYLTGRLRRSVDIEAQPGDVTLWSSVVYSRIWEYGGTVSPSGSPIEFPRTEFVGSEIRTAGVGAEDRLGAVLDSALQGIGF